MTTAPIALTYEGPLAAGTVALPDRRVPFRRHQTVDFTLAELVHLEPHWIGDRPAVDLLVGDAIGTERVGFEIPLGRSAEFFADTSGPDFVLIDGQDLGTIAAVLLLATSAERTAALLAHETATKNRPKLIAQLTELAKSFGPHPADEATTTEET